MKVQLFNPRSSAGRKPVLPMSLLAVAAVLEGDRELKIVDGNLDHDPVGTLDGLIGAGAADTLLGVTVMPGPQLEEAVPVCRELKRRHPALTIVWGGYFPSQHWDACLRSSAVDFVVRGHGEHVFQDLVASLEAGSSDYTEIAGLAWCDGDEPQSNPRAPIPHPDKLPRWNFDLVDMPSYLRSTFLGRRTVAAHTSYGCPYFCNFCAVVTMVEGRWLAESAERAAETFEIYRRRWGIDAVELTDNNFFVHEARVADFAGRVRPLEMAWWGEGRIDTMLRFSEDTWRAMRDGGLKMVFLGAESGSEETLKRMDKGGRMSPEATLELVELMRRWDIVPELSFVLGTPPDPDQDAASTMQFIRRVKRINPATEIIMYLYTPVPVAGDLLHQASAKGFNFPETLDEWVSRDWLDFAQRRSDTMSWINPSLTERIREFERVLNAYYPTTTMVSLTGVSRSVLRALSAWRYHTRIYRWPVELAAVHRLVSYQRPETTGF
jgi:tRNA A37 methylthiotransferase MiaB